MGAIVDEDGKNDGTGRIGFDDVVVKEEEEIEEEEEADVVIV